MPKPMLPQTEAPSWWSLSPDDLMRAARAKPEGLTTADADRIRSQVGANVLNEHRRDTALSMLLKQFTDPLVLILLFAAVVSAVVHEWTGTIIVMAIITASALLSFSQEYAASNAVETLRKQVTLKATVLRDGQPASIAAEAIVPGDIVLLSAGSLVPADGVVLEAKDFFVNQAVLTGETYPVEKAPGAVAAQATLNERHNMVFMGTNVRSGTARVLVVTTGTSTAFGQIADRLTLRPPETEFERGIRRFGYLLTRTMMALVAAIFVINALLE
ncbi:MAG: magnesium-translocating P-type ATPase, partial [Clostridiales bacterium]|nr:magnesium-translocating P-type ATPase [Clostridiales bacterium]